MTLGFEGVREMVRVALMCALLCVLCPFAIPVGPVPVTLGVFGVYLAGFVLSPLHAFLATLLYLLLGAIGLPVFAGYTAGVARIIGPTGGYLIGYLAIAVCVSAAVQYAKRYDTSTENATRIRRLLIQCAGPVTGLLLCYFFGTLWYGIQTHTPFLAALSVCVYPFLPVDILKICIALLTGNALRRALEKAQLL